MKNSTPIAERKFIVHALSTEEMKKVQENAAREKQEAEARMEARAKANADAGAYVDTKTQRNELDILNDWLTVNEGRHLRGEEKKAYRASASEAGAITTTELPTLNTYLEKEVTGIEENN